MISRYQAEGFLRRDLRQRTDYFANLAIDADPQQQEAASLQVLVVR